LETTLNKLDHNLATIEIQIAESDYKAKFVELLKKYAKNTNMKGFRPGKVPMGLINKMYGAEIKSETLNKAVQEQLFKYIEEQDLKTLFYPLLETEPLDSEQLKSQKDFTFSFKVQLMPDIDIPVDGQYEDAKSYDLEITDKDVDEQLEKIREQTASFDEVEEVSEGAFISGILEPASLPEPEAEAGGTEKNKTTDEVTEAVEVDDEGNELPKEREEADQEEAQYSYEQKDGRFRTMVPMNKIEGSFKDTFLGKKIGEKLIFDIRKAVPKAEDIKVLLQKSEEEADKVEGEYRLVIEKINAQKLPGLDQEFFKRVLGEEEGAELETLEDFKEAFRKFIAEQNKQLSDFLTLESLKKALIESTEIDLDQAFVKELLKNNQDRDMSDEDLDELYTSQIDLIKWEVISNKVLKDAGVEITEEKLLAEAKKVLNAQFQAWGMAGMVLPDDRMEAIAQDYLNNSEQNNRAMVENRVRDNAVLDLFQEKGSIARKSVTLEEAEGLYEEITKKEEHKVNPPIEDQDTTDSEGQPANEEQAADKEKD